MVFEPLTHSVRLIWCLFIFFDTTLFWCFVLVIHCCFGKQNTKSKSAKQVSLLSRTQLFGCHCKLRQSPACFWVDSPQYHKHKNQYIFGSSAKNTYIGKNSALSIVSMTSNMHRNSLTTADLLSPSAMDYSIFHRTTNDASINLQFNELTYETESN